MKETNSAEIINDFFNKELTDKLLELQKAELNINNLKSLLDFNEKEKERNFNKFKHIYRNYRRK